MLSFLNINLQELLIRIPLVLIALSFHEWGHAFAAYKLGDPTARNLGRMTLDPFKHVDIVGLISMVLFRFGWAKPVPVNPRNFKHLRRDDTIVSLAGITMNFLLAFVSVGLVSAIMLIFNWYNAVFDEIVGEFFFINLGLMVFNLLPVPPLDGYHVLKNALPRVKPQIWWNYERFGYIVLIGLMVTGVVGELLGTVVRYISSGISWFYGSLFSLFMP